MSEVNAWVGWCSLALAALAFLYPIFSGRSKDVDKRIEAKASKDTVAVLIAKVDVVEDKVTVIQNDLKHLPDKDTTHRLEIALKDTQAEMDALSERLKPIAAMASRIQEAMIENIMRNKDE